LKNKSTHNTLNILYKSIIKEQKQLFIGALVSLITSILILLIVRNVLLVIIGLVLFVLSIKFCFWTFRHRQLEDSRLYQLINHQPKKIVWIYSIVTQRMPFGFEMMNSGTLYFKLIDGDDISVSLSKDDILILAETLNTILPHASFGYTKDREQWYIANPELLINHEE